jgi:hypothetical protein
VGKGTDDLTDAATSTERRNGFDHIIACIASQIPNTKNQSPDKLQ